MRSLVFRGEHHVRGKAQHLPSVSSLCEGGGHRSLSGVPMEPLQEALGCSAPSRTHLLPAQHPPQHSPAPQHPQHPPTSLPHCTSLTTRQPSGATSHALALSAGSVSAAARPCWSWLPRARPRTCLPMCRRRFLTSWRCPCCQRGSGSVSCGPSPPTFPWAKR